jgi:hypothetical protein
MKAHLEASEGKKAAEMARGRKKLKQSENTIFNSLVMFIK